MPGVTQLRGVWVDQAARPLELAVPVDPSGYLYVRTASQLIGDQFSYNATAPARSGGSNPTFTGYAIKQEVGFTQFTVTPAAMTADNYLVVAWSSTVDDETNLGTIIDAYCDEIESGTGTLKAGVISTNIDKCMLALQPMTRTFDGTNTIKTILTVAVKLGSTTPAGAIFYDCKVLMA